jgi:hypothetical protein
MTNVAPNSISEKALHVPRPGMIAAPAPLPAGHTRVAVHHHPGLVIHGVDGKLYALNPGVTPVPTEVWTAWLAVHADSSLVTSGQVHAT